MAIRPIFIFSTVRTGSTLVQRVIGAHRGVSTVGEPWLLLPQFYAFRERGIQAEYIHPVLTAALREFCDQLPGGREQYFTELHNFVMRLYEESAEPGATHFVDKSTGYDLIADEVMNVFPEARFVFLWRNPLASYASAVQTFGPWRPTMLRTHFFIGLPRLVAAFSANRSRVHSAHFEQLTTGALDPWRELFDYLGVEFEPSSLERFPEVKPAGRMGDPTGVHEYSALSTEPSEKWKTVLANPLRVAWARRYLAFLGDERLAVMGYDGKQLRAELDALPRDTASLGKDLVRTIGDFAREPVRVRTRRQGLGGPNVIRSLLAARP